VVKADIVNGGLVYITPYGINNELALVVYGHPVWIKNVPALENMIAEFKKESQEAVSSNAAKR
jgi:hypothetical protein